MFKILIRKCKLYIIGSYAIILLRVPEKVIYELDVFIPSIYNGVV